MRQFLRKQYRTLIFESVFICMYVHMVCAFKSDYCFLFNWLWLRYIVASKASNLVSAASKQALRRAQLVEACRRPAVCQYNMFIFLMNILKLTGLFIKLEKFKLFQILLFCSLIGHCFVLIIKRQTDFFCEAVNCYSLFYVCIFLYCFILIINNNIMQA